MTRFLRITLLVLAVAVAVLPLLWMVNSSLRDNPALTRNLWLPAVPPTLANYQNVWRNSSFPRQAVNSIVVTLGAVSILGVVGALAGFGFARRNFRGKKTLWWIFLAGLFLPVHVTLIPLYRLEALLQLTGNAGALVYLMLVYIAFNLSFSVFFLRGFFAQLPDELEDAALVDGCTGLQVFRHIYLPLCLPSLWVVSLVNLVMIWNEFVFALVLLQRSEHYTLPLAVKNFSDETGLDLGATTAAITCTVLPILVIVWLGQRWIVRGLTAGAVKQ